MRGTTHLDRAGGRRRGGGRREAEGARVLRAAFRQHSGGWRSHRSRSCEAVVQDQQEAAAAPAVVSRRRARRLGPSAALVEGARRISFWGFLAPRLGVRVFAGRALRTPRIVVFHLFFLDFNKYAKARLAVSFKKKI